jgi:hypothetical protein
MRHAVYTFGLRSVLYVEPVLWHWSVTWNDVSAAAINTTTLLVYRQQTAQNT